MEKDAKCQVCGADLDGAVLCSVCGFEHHEWLVEPSAELKEYESGRLSSARQAWERLQEEKTSVTRNKPLGFLITENMVVYCLYEGENTFGSAKVSDTDLHQKLILSGYGLRPVHLSVTVTKGERTHTFTVKEVNPSEVPSVFVNSRTEPVTDGSQLTDGDNLLVSTGAMATGLKFRVNLNSK